MIKFIDIILCLGWGDTGKREISYQLNKNKDYDISLRVNGGANSGGMVHYEHNGNKGVFKLNQIPTGIFHGKKCIIGSGCVLNVEKFFKEIEDLKNIGIDVENKIFISKNTHIITKEHLEEDALEEKIGSTKQGISQAYRDKYSRNGIRAESIKELEPYLIDLYEEFYNPNKEISILVEMAQGYNLSIDSNDYPYVTSSHVSIGGALINSLPWNKIRKVYGCIKAYDTYVGNKEFQPKDEIFQRLQEVGKEIGIISGRKRQCNWLNIDSLIKAIQVNCVTHLIISKLDVLEELNDEFSDQFWAYKHSLNNVVFNVYSGTKKDFMNKIQSIIKDIDEKIKIQWRDAPACEVKI